MIGSETLLSRIIENVIERPEAATSCVERTLLQQGFGLARLVPILGVASDQRDSYEPATGRARGFRFDAAK